MKKFIGLIRIVAGLGILYFGAMKIFAGAGMEPISAAVEQFGLGFLSNTVWFWIVAISEALAGILLLTGRNHKLGAFIVLVVTGVAMATVGVNWNNGTLAVLSLILLFTGPGAWAMPQKEPATIEGIDDNEEEEQQQQ